MLKKHVILLFCMMFVQLSFAQKNVVTGTVKDVDGFPLIGATVVAKGTTVGVITDIDGFYSIKVPELKKPVLVVSYIGMETKEVPVDGQKVLNFTLEENTLVLDEVVAIGYGVVKRKEMMGAATQVSSEALEKTVSSDLSMALQGAVPGLSITSSTGEPGASANIQIRGVTSISGSNTPLFVVDGVPQEGDPMISSNEVAQIDVLKDAASCAIYGTRGAAGVILITTKSGQEGKARVTFDATLGIQEVNTSGLPNLMNSVEQTYFDLLAGRVGNNYTYDKLVILDVNKKPSYYKNDTDVYDMLINNYKPEQSYNVTVSGGNKNLTYSVVAGYYDQKGILHNASYDRINLRSNIVYTNDRAKLSVSSTYQLAEQSKASGTSIGYAMGLLPYSPELDLTAPSYEIAGESSDAAMTARLIRSIRTTDITETSVATVDAGFDYKITKDLTLTTKGGLRTQKLFALKKIPNISIYDQDGEMLNDGKVQSLIQNQNINRQSYIFTGGFNYQKKWNSGHKLSAIALFSYEQYENKGFIAGREGIMDNDLDVINNGTLNPYATNTRGYTDKLMGLIGRVMYDYQSRYLFSVSARADASSKFAKQNRWGMFPSVSAGWNVSSEKFWEPLQSTVSQFKIRGSYGTTGNQNFASYSFLPNINSNYDYSFGPSGMESVQSGAVQLAYANPDLKWETSKQANLGFDFGFLKNALLFSADFYDTKKDNMLATVKTPPSAGGGNKNDALVVRNIGNMTNRGMELNLSHKYTKKDFWINSSINYSLNRNEITHLGNDGAIIYNSNSTVTNGDNNSVVSVFAEGYEAGAFFLYKTNGVANTKEKLEEFQKIKPTAQMGDLIFVDTDGDGQITNNDRVYAGSALPSFEMGLNVSIGYKGFDISTNWYASVGNEAINGALVESYSQGRNENLLYMWSPSNPNSNIPAHRGHTKTHDNYIGYSDLWIEDASFLRMQLLSVGYTLTSKHIKVLPKSSSVRLSLSGQNLLTLTRYSGLDPEIGGNGLTNRGIDRGNYPVSRKYMFGVKVNF